MDVNFTVFIDKILSGEKRQTIRRASPKWKNVKVGDKLTLYTGLRTKECRKLGEAVVKSISRIVLHERDSIGGITREGEFPLTYSEIDILARLDGFNSVDDFWDFFNAHYPEKPIEMKVIRWTDFKEDKDER